jgi:hypothetical protein
MTFSMLPMTAPTKFSKDGIVGYEGHCRLKSVAWAWRCSTCVDGISQSTTMDARKGGISLITSR